MTLRRIATAKNQEQNIQQTRMKAKNILLTVGMCAGVGLVPLAAQTNEQQATPTPSPMNMMGMNQKQEQSSGMMGMKQMMGGEQMISNWKDQDAELDKLVAEMNSASADKKLEAVVTVLNKLVQQRKAMHEQMQKMMSANKQSGCPCSE
jgi:hypothetical protein